MTNNEQITIGSKLKEYFEQISLSQTDIANRLGVSQPAVSALLNGKPFGKNLAKKWGEEFGLKPNWLLTGEGKMLKEGDLNVQASTEEGGSSVLLLPISAQGGSLSNFAESVSAEQCERIVSPIKGVSFAMSVAGDSMEPEYPSGSKILIKKINERAFIEWGRCYVLDTCNGTVVKKLMPSDDPEKLKCVSTNTEYPPFDVYLTDIFGVYRVLMLLSEK